LHASEHVLRRRATGRKLFHSVGGPTDAGRQGRGKSFIDFAAVRRQFRLHLCVEGAWPGVGGYMQLSEIQAMARKALEEAAAAGTEAELEAVRARYLGRKGRIPALLRELGKAPPELRPQAGRELNRLKAELAELIRQRTAELRRKGEEQRFFDYTLPGDWRGLGTRHPVNRVIVEVVAIFRRLGFAVAEGPDVETEYHNFDALNTPADHPSRDIQDTFYLPGGGLLRTHTSPVQIRYMETHRPPVRVVAPGRCYRRDTPDATHSTNFHQVEGLYVDGRVSLSDLKSDLAFFARELMGAGVRVRFRPHFFPFTEPSVEVDFSCHVCGGRGCRLCKQSGWIEIAGAGMVHPKVLSAVGYDTGKYTGYAFGMGIERIAMILYGVDDIRLFYENDRRFLQQFGW